MYFTHPTVETMANQRLRGYYLSSIRKRIKYIDHLIRTGAGEQQLNSKLNNLIATLRVRSEKEFNSQRVFFKGIKSQGNSLYIDFIKIDETFSDSFYKKIYNIYKKFTPKDRRYLKSIDRYNSFVQIFDIEPKDKVLLKLILVELYFEEFEKDTIKFERRPVKNVV
jgi:hypothetical protein